MNQPDFTYIFEDLSNEYGHGPVCRINHRVSASRSIRVAVDDSQFLRRNRSQMPPEVADLIDIAVAVYTADRLSPQHINARRHLRVVVPVRHLELFDNAPMIACLQDVLYWLTDDYWTFAFERRATYGRPAEMRLCLPFASTPPLATEVALWSGGLDSLAGLCHRIFEDRQEDVSYTLLGTGGSTVIYRAQGRVATAVGRHITHPDRIKLVRVPIYLKDTHGIRKNAVPRARGFLFLLLGAICAFLEQQDSLHVYENGVGAINLPFPGSDSEMDHSRSVHPLSLLGMSDLVSMVFGTSFVIHNPFLFSTKAEMCEVLARAGGDALVLETVSCDRRHRRSPWQCGYCSSCLLRRQAIAAQGIHDRTSYVLTAPGRLRRPSDGIYLYAMLRQVEIIRSHLRAPDPWRSLSGQYHVLTDIVDRTARQHGLDPSEMKAQLLRMYDRYVHEWDDARPRIAEGLLTDAEMPPAA